MSTMKDPDVIIKVYMKTKKSRAQTKQAKFTLKGDKRPLMKICEQCGKKFFRDRGKYCMPCGAGGRSYAKHFRV